MIRAKKHLGQNFLRNQVIAYKIADLVPIEYPVIEIGPGDGSLTEALLETGHRVAGVEIDPDMIRKLKFKFKSRRDFRIHAENITKIEWQDIWSGQNQISVVGNLPYHMASSVLFKVFDHVRSDSLPHIMNCTFMVQLEVAKRITAEVGTKAYSSLSLLAQFHGNPELKIKVDRDDFYPKPKVNGGVITMNFDHPIKIASDVDYKQFQRIVRGTFSQRRKMLRNCLQAMGPLPEGWENLPFDFHLRPQQMSLQDFVNLTNHLVRLTELQNPKNP